MIILYKVKMRKLAKSFKFLFSLILLPNLSTILDKLKPRLLFKDCGKNL